MMSTSSRRWLWTVLIGGAAVAALCLTGATPLHPANRSESPSASISTSNGAALAVDDGELFLSDLLPFDEAPAPTIDNTTPQVGDVLTATAGDWEPTPDSLTFQWYNMGYPIEGADTSEYTVQPSDYGQELTVSVTASKAGYTETTLSSTNTSVVTAGTLSPGTLILSGTPTSGQTLSVDPGTWEPGDVALSYDWLRDGTSIGATDQDSYTLTSDDIGSTISVTVTGSEDDYVSLPVTSDSSDVVQGLPFDSTPTPVISDSDPVFNEELTVDVGDWEPGTVGLSYTWLRDGDPIDGATDSSYTTVSDDIGHTISVTVTGAEDGYATTSETSDATAAVAPLTFDGTPTPVLSDTAPVFNEELSITNLGDWDPGAALSYAWLRDGDPIDGATDSSYTTVSDDIGHTISVTVTGTEDGYTTVSETSDVTADVAALMFDSTPTPVISDPNPVFGETLTVDAGDWDAGAALSYVWLRDATPIAGATGSSYTTVSDDIGHAITVTVTGTEDGYTTASETSDATAAVLPLSFTTPGTVDITGPSSGAHVYTANTTDWSPTQDSLQYQWNLNGGPISGQTGRTFFAAPADVGESITVTVTPVKTGYAGPVTSDPVVPAIAYFNTGTPTIAGTPAVGQTLVAATGTWSPTPSTFQYTWIRGVCGSGTIVQQGTDISDASYVVQSADENQSVCVRVTGTGDPEIMEPATQHSASVTINPGTITPGTVTISDPGGLSVNSALTSNADSADWAPNSVALGYQWYRGAAQIPGATASTYILVPADLGLQVHLVVTGTQAGYTDEPATSNSLGPVTEAMFGGSQTVTVTGVADVGRTLTEAASGTLSPTPSSVAIAWLRGGVPISAATKSTYVLTPSDMGQPIAARVTSSQSGWQDYVATSAPVTPTGTFTTVPTPTITGTAKLESPLTAHAGVWTPAATLDYGWRVNGTVVQDGASVTYTPTTDDVGYPITVTVTGTAAGYASASATSAATVNVAAGVLTGVVPTITGTTTVNNTLTANEGSWLPTPDSFTYQWLRSGKAIAGATGESYLLAGADYAKTITVTVTAHLRGYTTLAKTSKATAAVRAGVLLTDVPSIAATAPVGTPIAVTRGSGWGPGGVTYGYQWYYHTATSATWVAVSKATAATYTPVASQLPVAGGYWFKVEVRGIEAGYTTSAFVSSNPAQVVLGTFATPAPTIAGTVQVGSTLTAMHTGWTPTASVVYHYQWYSSTSIDGSGAAAIIGATAATHVVASGDADHVLLVKVWATVAGYTPSPQVSSAPSAMVMTPFAVTVTGLTVHGDTLTANTPSLSEEATPTYQWYYLSGSTLKAITGATSQTYVISSSYKGYELRVRVTATQTGYATTATYSGYTAKIS